MKYNNLHIVIYLSFECNLRCSYCVINFRNEVIQIAILNNIISFINKYSASFNNIYVELIGGEPLLQLNEIKHLLFSEYQDNVKFQITTNGTIIDTNIYNSFIHNIDIVNLSYNENYFQNNKLFTKISKILLDKNNININFIYDPNKKIEEIKRNFLFVLKEGYKNINILPIVLIHNYSKDDFVNLINFINFSLKYSVGVNISYIYYIQEKDNHFEFTINPDGSVLGDNMGTAEEFFLVKNRTNKSIGYIGELSIDDIYYKLKDYNYINYLRNITESGNTKQNYNNLLLLSNLLKKYSMK